MKDGKIIFEFKKMDKENFQMKTKFKRNVTKDYIYAVYKHLHEEIKKYNESRGKDEVGKPAPKGSPVLPKK